MYAELDTGPIFAQAPVPLGDEHAWEELEPADGRELQCADGPVWIVEREPAGSPPG
jgi:hypothetical protein